MRRQLQSSSRHRLRYCARFLALAPVVMLCGCTLLQPTGPTHFRVDSPALDTLEILYLPDPALAPPSRITLLGSGQARLRRGDSPRVMNSFSTETDHPRWHDYHEDSLGVSMDEMREILQRFVDLGLYAPPRRTRPSAEPPFPIVRIHGRIQRHPVHRPVTEPDLILLVESILNTILRNPAQPRRP